MHRMRQSYVSNSWHHLRPDPHSTDGLVFCLLAFCCWQKWDLGAELETDVGDRLLPDGVGNPSSLAVCADSSRSGAPLREGRGGRNLHWRQRSWTFRRPCQREEDPDVYRDRDPGAEGIRALSNGACGGCLRRIASLLRVTQYRARGDSHHRCLAGLPVVGEEWLHP